MFYKIENRMILMSSTDGKSWNRDDDQMWINNSKYFQIDANGNVYFQQ